jgi:hypothetical protein
MHRRTVQQSQVGHAGEDVCAVEGQTRHGGELQRERLEARAAACQRVQLRDVVHRVVAGGEEAQVTELRESGERRDTVVRHVQSLHVPVGGGQGVDHGQPAVHHRDAQLERVECARIVFQYSAEHHGLGVTVVTRGVGVDWLRG